MGDTQLRNLHKREVMKVVKPLSWHISGQLSSSYDVMQVSVEEQSEPETNEAAKGFRTHMIRRFGKVALPPEIAPQFAGSVP